MVVRSRSLLLLVIVGRASSTSTPTTTTRSCPAASAAALTGAATVFFAVFGYDAMSTAAEESKDGKKHMPKAIIYSLVIAMVLYVAATLVLTGMQNYKDIDPEAGFAVRVRRRSGCPGSPTSSRWARSSASSP